MKKICSCAFAIVVVAFFSISAYSQIRQLHLYIDDGTGHFTILTAPSGGGALMFPPGNGTLLMASPTGQSYFGLNGPGGFPGQLNILDGGNLGTMGSLTFGSGLFNLGSSGLTSTGAGLFQSLTASLTNNGDVGGTLTLANGGSLAGSAVNIDLSPTNQGANPVEARIHTVHSNFLGTPAIIQLQTKAISTPSSQPVTRFEAFEQSGWTFARVNGPDPTGGSQISIGNDANGDAGQLFFTGSTDVVYGGASSLNFENVLGGTIAFERGGSYLESMRIDPNGNLLIGNTTGTSLLSVGSSAQLTVDGSGNLSTSGTLTSTSTGGITTGDGSHAGRLNINDGSGHVVVLDNENGADNQTFLFPTTNGTLATQAYVDNAASATNFIQNQNTGPQAGANFNIGGNGTIAGDATVGGTLHATDIEDVVLLSINTSSGHTTNIGNASGGTSITGTNWSIVDAVGEFAFGHGSTAGFSSLAAGWTCAASGSFSTSIGDFSTASGSNAIAAGDDAVALGNNAIAIGSTLQAAGDFSMVLGQHASDIPGITANGGSFVFGDNSTSNWVYANNPNEFDARAAGGVHFYTKSDLSTGVSFPANGGMTLTGGLSVNASGNLSTSGNITTTTGRLSTGVQASSAGQLVLQPGQAGATNGAILQLDPTAGLFRTSDRTYNLPDNSGTVALTSQIPTASNYIANSNSLQSSANFNIDGSGTIGGGATIVGATNINTSGTATTTIGSTSGGNVSIYAATCPAGDGIITLNAGTISIQDNGCVVGGLSLNNLGTGPTTIGNSAGTTINGKNWSVTDPSGNFSTSGTGQFGAHVGINQAPGSETLDVTGTANISSNLTTGGPFMVVTHGGTINTVDAGGVALQVNSPLVTGYDINGSASSWHVMDGGAATFGGGAFHSPGSVAINDGSGGSGNIATLNNANGSTATLSFPTTGGTLSTTANINSAVSGTSGTIAKFTGTNTVGNSIITDDGTQVVVSPTSNNYTEGISINPSTNDQYAEVFYRITAGSTTNTWYTGRMSDQTYSIGDNGINGMVGTSSGDRVLTIQPPGSLHPGATAIGGTLAVGGGSADAVSASIQQNSHLTPASDIFDITNPGGATKYFYIDNNGVTNIGGSGFINMHSNDINNAGDGQFTTLESTNAITIGANTGAGPATGTKGSLVLDDGTSSTGFQATLQPSTSMLTSQTFTLPAVGGTLLTSGAAIVNGTSTQSPADFNISDAQANGAIATITNSADVASDQQTALSLNVTNAGGAGTHAGLALNVSGGASNFDIYGSGGTWYVGNLGHALLAGLNLTGELDLNGDHGTLGYLLKSNGVGAPSWVDPSSIGVAHATNSDHLETKTWEVPGTIGSTTPSSGAFTTFSAGSSALAVDATGNLSTSGTITTTAAVANGSAATIDNTGDGGGGNVAVGLTINDASAGSTAANHNGLVFDMEHSTTPHDIVGTGEHWYVESATGNITTTGMVSGAGITTTGNLVMSTEGPITESGNAATVSGNKVFAEINGAPTTDVAVTVTATPVTGQILYLYNHTTGGHNLTLNTQAVLPNKIYQFIFYSGNWLLMSN